MLHNLFTCGARETCATTRLENVETLTDIHDDDKSTREMSRETTTETHAGSAAPVEDY